MIEELDVFADLHAVFSRRHAHGDFPKCARKSRCYRFAAKTLKGRDPFLPEQNKRVAVDGGSNVNNVRTRQIRGDGRGATLIDVDGARDNALDRDGGPELTDGHAKTALVKVTRVQGDEQWQAGRPGTSGTDFEAALLRLGKFGAFGNPRPDSQKDHGPDQAAPSSSQTIFHRFL